MSAWINGRRGRHIDYLDRGLQYGDGLFETMRVRGREARLLDYHLDRLYEGCGRLGIEPPERRALRREIARAAAMREEGVLKLIVTRGVGTRGYRPSGSERCTRILALGALPPHAAAATLEPLKVKVCRTRLGMSRGLAGLKTLNRLEQVLARSEWRDARIGEGLMQDTDDNVVCGTMSNLFLRRGARLVTPPVDRCGVAGVMRRWILEQADGAGLRPSMRSVSFDDLSAADEVFMSNAVAGVMPVGEIRHGANRIRPSRFDAALALRARLESL